MFVAVGVNAKRSLVLNAGEQARRIENVLVGGDKVQREEALKWSPHDMCPQRDFFPDGLKAVFSTWIKLSLHVFDSHSMGAS